MTTYSAVSNSAFSLSSAVLAAVFYICPVGNDILEHILDHMVVLHDSGLYIRTVLITKCSTDISCRRQHFLCMCKNCLIVPAILVCIRVSDSLDSGKYTTGVACRNSTYVSSS